MGNLGEYYCESHRFEVCVPLRVVCWITYNTEKGDIYLNNNLKNLSNISQKLSSVQI